MYKNNPAIATAGNTRPTSGTRIDGRYKLSILYSFQKNLLERLRTLFLQPTRKKRIYSKFFSWGAAKWSPSRYYSKSFDLGLRPGSLDKKPKMKSDTKKITTVYTKTFNANIVRRIMKKENTNRTQWVFYFLYLYFQCCEVRRLTNFFSVTVDAMATNTLYKKISN